MYEKDEEPPPSTRVYPTIPSAAIDACITTTTTTTPALDTKGVVKCKLGWVWKRNSASCVQGSERRFISAASIDAR